MTRYSQQRRALSPVKSELVEIFEAVSLASGLTIAAIRGRRRTRAAVWARFAVVVLAQRRFPWWSQSQLADIIGRSDHGTAANALARAAELAAGDADFAALLSRAAGHR